ncbi:ABC transporter ATP-binding protein [Nocardiopsis sp. HNM0947]|uniref:ABC transporter ATP-binding protein n=1 Tax=Nocardiopsis coralli TaxID=2772213 RepID=A0ABR9PET9_9ACTN|nr:ABC transporter ATP-binding protein [Nocardiopsis coralli]MBE3002346.1 ABC transporter ATP-binding protein [Nocardiopsis coralli]
MGPTHGTGTLRTLARILARLRDAGAVPAVALVAVRLMERLVTPVTAVALAALVGTLSGAGDTGTVTAALLPLGFLALVMLAGHLGDAAAEPLEYLVSSRIDGAHRDRVARMVREPSELGTLEAPQTQALIRQVRADPEHGVETTPGDGTTAAVRVAAGLAGVAVTCAVLASFAWWLVPIVLVPALVTVVLRYRLAVAGAATWVSAIGGEQHVDVWRRANVSAAEGKDIRVFGLRDWMVDRMQSRLGESNAPLWRHVEHRLRVEWLMFVLVLVGLVPAYLLVTLGSLEGAATVATQTAVLAAGATLFQLLGNGWDLYQLAGAGRDLRATDRLASEIESAGSAPAQRVAAPGAAVGEVRFEGVGFRYPGSERMVLEGVDLTVRPGELLAVVGLNGAGKSTLIKLLCGLYRPTHGRITVDGTDLAAVDPGQWRALLSVIFQDFDRYPLSVRENVVLGRGPDGRGSGAEGLGRTGPDEVGDADLEHVARTSGLADIVAGLPAGWDTPLSRGRTGGVDLSGGQWQQVALARALYGVRAGARFLVADEPTAHLDVRTEFRLFERLADQRAERDGRDGAGIVLISHRLSTVRRADRIVLLDGGRITEEGTHPELMALRGTYADLFETQAARFRNDNRATEADRGDTA